MDVEQHDIRVDLTDERHCLGNRARFADDQQGWSAQLRRRLGEAGQRGHNPSLVAAAGVLDDQGRR